MRFCEKACLWDFALGWTNQPVQLQKYIEKKKRDCIVSEVKSKILLSCAVISQLIFVSAFA